MTRPALRWALAAFATIVSIGLGTSDSAATDESSATIRLPIRWQVATEDKSQVGQMNYAERELIPTQTAILICDTWDKHWCASATRRCDALARKMAPLVEQARARGVHIIHAPSDTLDFYRDHPARQRALATPAAKSPMPIGGWCSLDKGREGSLPIDDADGGCDCQPQCKNYKAWSRQHSAIAIHDTDLISDNGQEVYNYLTAHGIKNILYVGVHTNMCVLGRSFGIRQMSRLGFNTLLVRDLTDTMYNPRQKPFVEHDAGTALVIGHIERHWCPTTDSAALAAGLR